MKEWWQRIEEQLDEHSERAPDPWSDRAGRPVELTDAQQQFLGGFDDQPPIIRTTDGPGITSLQPRQHDDEPVAVPRPSSPNATH